MALYEVYNPAKLAEVDALGSVYLAPEGVNAQLAVPASRMDELRAALSNEQP